MRSLRALNGLLLLFVLVPAGVLGWLGLKAADGYEAEMTALYRRIVAEAVPEVRRRAVALLEAANADERRRLSEAAAFLEVWLPFYDAAQGLQAAQRMLWAGRAPLDLDRLWLKAGMEVAVLARDGRAVLPAELSPDAPVEARSEQDRLVADLGRAADRALYGEHDPAAARAVWAQALERAKSEALRARLATEALWTEVRAGALIEAELSSQIDQLLASWSPEVLRATGRAWYLTLFHTGRQALLQSAMDSTAFLETPFTTQERERLRAGLLHADAPLGPVLVSYAPLPHDQRLRVVRRVSAEHVLEDLLSDPRMPPPPGVVVFSGHRWRASPTSASHELTLEVEIARPGGAPVRLVLVHPAAEGLRREVARRKTWTAIAVSSLLGVVLLGLLLTRRAVAREREAVRLRDEFLANVSHELRTPLTSVSLHADLLTRPDLTPEKRRAHLDVVQAESARLSALVEDLLDFAALERGARRLEPEPVDVGAAVERALAPYRVLAERQGVHLAAPPAPRAVEALVDFQALARILANLVGNAFKHGTPARDGGTPSVRVLVQRPEALEGPTMVEVRDNGPGIPADERSRLFERFQRGGAAARRPGTGLGLSLSRSLARAMEGDLIYVEDPRETVFRLTLPSVPATIGTDDEVKA